MIQPQGNREEAAKTVTEAMTSQSAFTDSSLDQAKMARANAPSSESGVHPKMGSLREINGD